MGKRTTALLIIGLMIACSLVAYFYGGPIIQAGVLGFGTALVVELLVPPSQDEEVSEAKVSRALGSWHTYNFALQFLSKLEQYSDEPFGERIGAPDYQDGLFSVQTAIGMLHNDGLIDTETALRASHLIVAKRQVDTETYQALWNALLLGMWKGYASEIVERPVSVRTWMRSQAAAEPEAGV